MWGNVAQRCSSGKGKAATHTGFPYTVRRDHLSIILMRNRRSGQQKHALSVRDPTRLALSLPVAVMRFFVCTVRPEGIVSPCSRSRPLCEGEWNTILLSRCQAISPSGTPERRQPFISMPKRRAGGRKRRLEKGNAVSAKARRLRAWPTPPCTSAWPNGHQILFRPLSPHLRL